ncbi:Protein NRT1/ PTR FAMILY 4.6 [Striga hermonthica]|uniref:Protein NRT1/ PTR FAMILY 4.6 n=1 Tax=Striga hermonthica TaxID=68872 RepID=A0A9N7NKV2_STRHE|nr:Protein NRT1/ PTR FAMILY 4.6 [Striga hermonthica]
MMKKEVENQLSNTWDGYVDWRGRAALRAKHGGMFAASFVLVVEILENLAYLANASNLVLYFSEYMHFTPSESANSVTNFMGTAFLLALLGGFLSDAFFTTYQIYLASAVIEFLGLVILAVQAHSSSLKPPRCSPTGQCEKVHGPKAAMLFLDESTPLGRKQRSTFFNYFVFSLSVGALIAVTLVVWIEDNKGWEWGFGISTLAILLSIPVFLAGSAFYRNKLPLGSPLTTICKVLLASLLNTCMPRSIPGSTSNAIANMSASPYPLVPADQIHSDKLEENAQTPSQSLRFLNRAVTNKPALPILKCSVKDLEEVKIVFKILPIFACTVILNTCLAQLSTFSVQQAATMDTRLGSMKVPPASLPVFPVVFIMILAPLYDHVIIPFARRATKSETGVTHLRRIGIGLFLSIVAMAVAALVEAKRKRVAGRAGTGTGPLPITFFWIALQYLFLGSADLFTLAGLLEFFFTEAPFGMRSLATSLSFASLAVGYYMSTVIVSVVNRVTGGSGHGAWLSGANLNEYQLERFYWLMCVLSGLNFLNYLFWASKYKYRGMGSSE